MAQIVSFGGAQGVTRFPLFRRTTTLGSDQACDVPMSGAGIMPVHAEIRLEGTLHQILPFDGGGELLVNGRKVKRADLALWDVIRLGSATLVYAPDDLPLGERTGKEKSAFTQLESLGAFSRRLMEVRDLDRVLSTLLDETLQLTDASKGMLIFVENGAPQVKVARNIDRKSLPADEVLFSESIVNKALSEGEPQLVIDALHNQEFANCTSVINLQLASVMCVPLKVGGETLGALYLGTDKLLHLFDDVKLKTLNIYAAQAAIIIQNLLIMDSLEKDNIRLKEDLKATQFGSLIGACEGMQDVFRKVSRVAPTDIPVMVLGETGTGKELIARELHRRSTRAEGPFVAVNCGAIPEGLLESELFGHVRGAFTGAVATTAGKFHVASGGTLFLDEVADLPLSLQVKLLRVLQDGMVTRVGSSRPEHVNVRIVTATNRDLKTEIKAGRFREDLFFRVAVVAIVLPPLRDRGDDIELLAQYFLTRFAGEFGVKVRGFSPEAVKAMRKYPWPGNIREMENRLRKALLFADGPMVKRDHLDLPEADPDDILPLGVARERFERDYVMGVLRKNQGNRTKTARDLGVEPRTIFRYLERERNTSLEGEP